MTNKYLFLFTISPVQSFIEQARKTQDLYAGSYILSDLCKCAIKRFKEFDGSLKVIFPNNPESDSIPNRFLGEIELEENELEKTGKSIEICINSYFNIIFLKNQDLSKINKVHKNQIRNFLEMNWCFYPIVNDDYKTAYENIEKELGGIKNIRLFNQVEEEAGRKCDLCGERNGYFYKKNNKKHIPAYVIEDSDYIEKSKESLKYLTEGECLCAVCYSKRKATSYYNIVEKSYNDKFPCTAEIAYKEILTLNSQINDLWKSLEKGKEYFDPEDIFNYYSGDKKLNTENSEKKISDICNLIRENQINFTPYYALILFDGDNMGKWLSGEKLKEDKDTERFHMALSKKLADFAERAKELAEDNKGKAVYAGGDDFLGFVPLENLSKLLQELREEFKKIINDNLFNGQFELGKDYENEKMSFSAGIVIAHLKAPLSKVLSYARKSEKKAKAIDGKNAFCLTLLKRSGEIVETTYKWENNIFVLRNFNCIFNIIKDKRFSTTFIDNLAKEFYLIHDDGKLCEYKSEMFKLEMKRLLGNSCMIEGKNKEEKKLEIEKFNKILIELYETSKCKEGYDMSKFLDMLEIIKFLVKKTGDN